MTERRRATPYCVVQLSDSIHSSVRHHSDPHRHLQAEGAPTDGLATPPLGLPVTGASAPRFPPPPAPAPPAFPPPVLMPAAFHQPPPVVHAEAPMPVTAPLPVVPASELPTVQTPVPEPEPEVDLGPGTEPEPQPAAEAAEAEAEPERSRVRWMSLPRPLLLGAAVLAPVAMVAATLVALGLLPPTIAGDGSRATTPTAAPGTGGAAESTTGTTVPPFFVDPDSPAAKQQRQWESEGRDDDARRIGQLAAQPLPEWVTSPRGRVAAEIDGYVDRAVAAGAQPLLVAYNMPGRDCGSFSGGGASDGADYRAWIREFAAALDGRGATVILEPDALAHAVQGCSGSAEERFSLLADAVSTLKAAGPVQVYVDAGNPSFPADKGALADALRRSGVAEADGFALNVANFYRTEDALEHGRQVSAAVDGARFVVDTSRNGNGKIDGDVNGGPSWCNPPGRSIGPTPTTDTGDPLVAAFLWIKRVGESDGTCRPGEPPAGQWWPEYALGLV